MKIECFAKGGCVCRFVSIRFLALSYSFHGAALLFTSTVNWKSKKPKRLSQIALIMMIFSRALCQFSWLTFEKTCFWPQNDFCCMEESQIKTPKLYDFVRAALRGKSESEELVAVEHMIVLLTWHKWFFVTRVCRVDVNFHNVFAALQIRARLWGALICVR